MVNTSARKNILTNIRIALSKKAEKPFPDQSEIQPLFKRSADMLIDQFASEFTRLTGKLIYYDNPEDLTEALYQIAIKYEWKNINCAVKNAPFTKEQEKSLFLNTGPAIEANAIITDCECLIARTGTILLSSSQYAGRGLPVFTPVHLVFALESQLVPDLSDALRQVKEKYPERLPSVLSFASGPSRTADIEKTLIIGVHGPKEVYVFLKKNS